MTLLEECSKVFTTTWSYRKDSLVDMIVLDERFAISSVCFPPFVFSAVFIVRIFGRRGLHTGYLDRPIAKITRLVQTPSQRFVLI
mmetsp:Transcript_5439/g.11828  ORF Transcript_5439/g.11828 Transcript_5439/m.11828 type:complete len:85 (+) Transcript_5439:2866-3120(+)